MMEFLYFPEDKTQYIPAFLSMAPFILGAIFAFWWIVRLSKKELARFESSPYASLSQGTNSDSDTEPEKEGSTIN